MAREDEPIRSPLPFPERRLDRAAVEVVRRLHENGFESYLVGGCVRDLLLGRVPKDFDLATAARPEQVRRLFRRSRVIGRRFKLTHVYRGRKIFEVATFRAAPAEAGGEARLIRFDNRFGTAREDALRRDFTANGLFLNPQRREIVDWVGGIADVSQHRLRSIGNPMRRFREDPVRILRAIKFMRRLDLQPGPEEIEAARRLAPHLREAARPRVAEEVFRLMLTGDMEGVLADLEALGLIDVILPEIAGWLGTAPQARERLDRRLRVLDQWIREGETPSAELRLAILLGPRIEDEFDPRSRSLEARELPQVPALLLRQLQARARLPRAILSGTARILLAQLRMDPPEWLRHGRGKRVAASERLLEMDCFDDALDCLRCRLEADGRDMRPYDAWRERSLSRKPDGR